MVSFLTSNFLNIDWAVSMFGSSDGITNWERQNWEQGIGVFTITGAGLLWFLFIRRFYAGQTDQQKADIETFSTNLDRPVDFGDEDTGPETDDKQSYIMGWLCIPYGAVVILMALIPNPMLGRFAFLFCGITVITIGTLLVRQSKAKSTP